MSEQPTIFELIPKVMADVGAIGKNSTNEQQRFKFRGIEAVVNGIGPALIKHGIFYSPTTLSAEYGTLTTSKGTTMRTCVLEIQFRFYGPLGDYFDAVVYGESADMGDKATNKATSAAQKYALCNVFNVMTQDMEDADATTPSEGTHSPSPRANTTTQKRQLRKPPTGVGVGEVKATSAMRQSLIAKAFKSGLDEDALSDVMEKEVGKRLDDAEVTFEDINKMLAYVADPGRPM